MSRARLRKLRIEEISAVDSPAQRPARAAIMKREPVQKLKPRPDESEQDFVSRFMGDAGMRSEFPEQAQRAAVAHSMYRQYRVSKDEDMSDEPLEPAEMLLTTEDVEKADIEKASLNAEQRRRLAESGAALPDGSFPIRNAKDLMNAIHAWGRANPSDRAKVARHIKRRAQALGLSDRLPKEGPLAEALSKGLDNSGDPNPESNKMTPDEKAAIEKAAQEKLEALQKRAERAERLAELTDAQRALFAKMDQKEQDRFLTLKPEQRQSEVEKAAEKDSVVYTDLDGQSFRKSDDPRLVAMAKRADEDRKARLGAEAQSRVERLQKRASEELKNLPGTAEDKALLLGAVETIPAEKRGAIEAILKAHNANLSKAFETLGTSNVPAAGTPEGEIEAIAKRIRVENPKLSPAQAYVKALETPEGRQLYTQRAMSARS